MKKIFQFGLFLCSFAVYAQKDPINLVQQMEEMNESMYPNVLEHILPTFIARDTNGIIITNDVFKRGKVTFINLWFSACRPCIDEMPALNAFYQRMKDDTTFQFISMTWEQQTNAKANILKHNLCYPVFFTSPSTARQVTFGRGYPTNIIVDEHGRVFWICSGGMSDDGVQPENYSRQLEIYWKERVESAKLNFSQKQ